jgi:hypothetical protein
MEDRMGFFSEAKSLVELTILIEVVDHPDESSDFRGYTKPVMIWFLWKKQPASLPLPLEAFTSPQGKWEFLGSITKQTPRDARQRKYIDNALDRQYLCVLAKPAAEWGQHYAPSQCMMQVSLGHTYNITVALEPTSTSSRRLPPGDPAPRRTPEDLPPVTEDKVKVPVELRLPGQPRRGDQ